MPENFFTDNADLQFRLEQLDLSQVVELHEDGYRYQDLYPGAPRNYRDAKDNYRLLLTALGEICATRVAPQAAAELPVMISTELISSPPRGSPS